ncbi:MAG: DegT/DnrJ/EryC1/StrS family aminotransferase [Gemmataceae bacterium]
MFVPFMDLKAQSRALRAEILAGLERVLDSSVFALGEETERFETAFAAYLGSKHCVGVNSGTSALHLALLCAGVGPGDEVITVPMTFIATCWAISYVGAKPVFVDINSTTYTMDVEQVEKAITPRTRALMPVHLYGQPADLDPLMEIGRRHGIPVIEDAAQAHGAQYRGRCAGTIGQSGCFSFYPAKNLGACGEGGALITDDDQLAARVRALRDHAQEKRYHHGEIGFNYRMDAFQGAALGVKLKHLESWNNSRRQLAQRYREQLADLPLTVPIAAEDRSSIWHLFVVLHPERDRLRKELEARGIQTGLHYPVPVHLQKAYRHLNYKEGDFPMSERVGRECLSLPLFPEMTLTQQDAVVQALRELLR